MRIKISVFIADFCKMGKGLAIKWTKMHLDAKILHRILTDNLFKNHLIQNQVAEDHIIEIAFDSFENKKYRDPDVLYPYLMDRISDAGMYYVLLDEVQLLEDFEFVLNSLVPVIQLSFNVCAQAGFPDLASGRNNT